MLFADFVERDIGDSELLRQVRHRLGPDEFVELLTRKDPGHDHPFQKARIAVGAIKRLIPHGHPNMRDAFATHVLKQIGTYEQPTHHLLVVVNHYGRSGASDQVLMA